MHPEQFHNPANKYRPAPFWSVNDALEDDKLRHQVREFARVGYGGWFFHPRVGIATKYLSEAWMDAFAAALDEGKKLGHLCWIYDEDSYPSGFAGGQLLQQYPEYRAHYIHLTFTEVSGSDKLVRRFAVRRSADTMQCYRPLEVNAAPAENEELLTFVLKPGPNSGWMNNSGYVDLLNPAAVKCFLKITHERYAERFGDDFGRHIPGVFTDEPHIYTVFPHSLVWTEDLPQLFAAKYGYSLLDRLPELFLHNSDCGRVRSDYWRLLAELFQASCIQQMADWCKQHDLILTGHCWEHEYPWTRAAGSMGFAEIPMQWPGIDLLGANTSKEKVQGHVQRQVGRIGLVKSISSLKHQFGRDRIMSETYGGAGWDVTFRDLKEILDWECVLGVDYVVPHLSHYSLRGCRKRDFPPAFLDYAPWWSELKVINDYTGRLCYALHQGKSEIDIAVLQPLSPAWTHSLDDAADKQEVDRFGLRFENLLKELSGKQWEYDLLDEMTLQRHARIEAGKLYVGKAAYSLLIIPQSKTLSAHSAAAIEQFLNADGNVLWLLPAPSLLDGQHEAALRQLQQHSQSCLCTPDAESLVHALSRFSKRTLATAAAAEGAGLPLYVHSRRLDHNTRIVFWSNSSNRGADLKFHISGHVEVEDWDLLSGKVQKIETAFEDQHSCWTATVAPGESQLLKIKATADSADFAVPAAISQLPGSQMPLGQSWQIRSCDRNALVLDRAAYRIASGEWSETMEIWQLLQELRHHFGVDNEEDLRYNRAARFYDIWQNPKIYADIELHCIVVCNQDPFGLGPIDLVVESGERFQLAVNGKTVPGPTGTWLTADFSTFRIESYLRTGENHITITTVFSEDTELEAMYILGNFGVHFAGAANLYLDAPPQTLQQGSWVQQGLPFFGGRLRVAQKVEITQAGEWFLTAAELPLPLAKVFVDGQETGALLWPPFRISLGHLTTGPHRIELECISGFRNTFGPWHTTPENDETPLTGPAAWVMHHADDGDSYYFTPEGIPVDLRLECC